MSLERLDGYIDDDAFIFGDAPRGFKVVKALGVSMPPWSNAPQSLLNEVEHEIRSILHLIKDDMELQIICRTHSELKGYLDSYYEKTREATNEWSIWQRDTIYANMTEAMNEGKLRFSEITLYLTKRSDFGGTEKSFEGVIAASLKTLDLVLEEMVRCFERPGGMARMLTKAELVKACLKHFQPGSEWESLQPEKLLSPEKTIFQNFIGSEFLASSEHEPSLFYNGFYHGYVALHSLPILTTPGLIGGISSLPVRDYSIVVKAIPVDTNTIIAKEESGVAKRKRSLRTGQHIAIETTIRMLEERIRRLSTGDVRPFTMQCMIGSRAKTQDELQRNLSMIQTAVYKLNGAKPFMITLPTSCRNAFFFTMPGSQYQEPAFKQYIEDINLAHMLPVSGHMGPGAKESEALYYGENGALDEVITFGRAAEAGQPLLSFVAGSTGCGKSNFICNLLTQTEPYYHYTVIIDNGQSYSIYVETFPGKIKTLVLAEDGENTFNILSTAGQELTYEFIETVANILALMADKFVRELNRRRALLSKLLAEFYAYWSEQWMQKCESGENISWEKVYALMAEGEQPTFSDFHDWLSQRQMTIEQHYASDVRDLALVLERWRRDRGCKLFDGENTVNLKGEIVHLELGKLGSASEEFKIVAIHIITNFIGLYIQNLPRNQRKRIVCEELGAFLKIPGSEVILKDFYERARKYNTWVVSVIQGISTLPEKVQSSILVNTKSAFLFRQKNEAEARALQKAFNLPESALQNLLRFPAPSKEQGAPFLHWRAEGQRNRVVVSYNIASPEMLYVSRSDGEHHEAREKAKAKYGGDMMKMIEVEAPKQS